LCVDFGKPITIVEGIFDAIVTDSYNTVPLLGDNMTTRSKLFSKIMKYKPDVYIALDPDAEKIEDKVIENLCKENVKVYKIEIKCYKDLGDMPRDEYLLRRESAQIVTIDDLLLKKLNNIGFDG
jgi:hypothetical protein